MADAGARVSDSTREKRTELAPESALDDFLRRVHWLAQGIQGSQFLGQAISVALLLGILAILSDAAFSWPTPIRLAIDVVAISAGLTVVGLVAGRLWLNRYRPAHAARLTEERLQRGDSLLVNAVEFRSRSECSGSPALRSRVIAMADELVRDLTVVQVISPRPASRAGVLALTALVVFGLSAALAPRLFGMVVPRFLDPLGDHPPYTLLRFAVTISPEPVFHSRPATITVDISGPETVEQASLVFTGTGGRSASEANPLPMFRAEDRRFVAEIPSAEQSAKFYISTPRGRSELFDFEVVTVPFFEETRVRLTPPEYTGWEAYEQKLEQRGLRGLMGTLATVTARSNLPLAGGELTLIPVDPGKESGGVAGDAPVTVRLLPLADDPRQVAGEFSIEFSGRFELTLRSTSGAETLEPLSGPIVALPDRTPQISIVTPDQSLVVVEDWKVPVQIEAADDVRVDQLRFYRSVNDWGPAPIELPVVRGEGPEVRGVYEFDLASLGAKAGDVIHYSASVTDNHPGTPNSADSLTHTLQVISPAEYQEFARQNYQMDELAQEFETFRKELERLGEQRQEVLEDLEELRKRSEQPGQLTPQEQQQAGPLEEQLRKYSEETEKLRKTLEERARQLQLYELEKEYTEQLQEIAQQLEQQGANSSEIASQLEQLGRPAGDTPENREQLQRAIEKFQADSAPFNAESKEQQEATADDLEVMKQADALMAQTDRLRAVIAQQRDLANRLAEFAGRESLTGRSLDRSERFAKEQELLQQELQSLQNDLLEAAEQAAERLPKMADSARQITEKIVEKRIEADQQEAAAAARKGNGDLARHKAETAARNLEALEALAGECEQCQGLQEEMDGPLSLSRERLGQCLKQMSQGRKIPGLGQRGNQRGQGQGQGGQSAGQGDGEREGEGEGGDQPGPWNPGQSFPGSQANMQVMGPRTQKTRPMENQEATLQSDGRGQFITGDGSGQASDRETINPTTREHSGSSAGNLRGVPVGYRDAAEAYFRRLTEEQQHP